MVNMRNSIMKTYWTNPWTDIISVPLNELAEALAHSGLCRMPDGTHELMNANHYIRGWSEYGDKLDAYIIKPYETDYGFSVGVRYGNEGNQYLSPHARDTEKMNVLYQKYKKE